jgi:acyl-CoA reductase-like NAD-dependent aldehyde dehydrogenase
MRDVAAEGPLQAVKDIFCPELGAFGGVKQSGFGRGRSLHAMDEYSYVKSVWLAH